MSEPIRPAPPEVLARAQIRDAKTGELRWVEAWVSAALLRPREEKP